MPQRRTKHSPADALADEFGREKASALGRLGRALEATLAALAEFDVGHSRATSAAEDRQLRASLVAEASVALWHFVVQREACGLRDLRYVLRDYRVPHEVAARMGVLPREPRSPRRKPYSASARLGAAAQASQIRAPSVLARRAGDPTPVPAPSNPAMVPVLSRFYPQRLHIEREHA